MQNKTMTMILLQADEEEAAFNRAQFTAVGIKVLEVCANGTEAVRCVTALRPDVVLMDGFLPGRGSDEIIRLLRAEGGMRHTVLAVLSGRPNDRLAQQVMDAGCDLFLLAPLDYPYIQNRFAELLKKKNTREEPSADDRFIRERYVTGLMHEIGVPAHIRGYDYIRDSILLALESREVLKSITRDLYPAIAERNDTTAARVERAIRHAIEIAWERGDIELLHRIFGFTVSSVSGNPTNGEFISILTERIRLDHQII